MPQEEIVMWVFMHLSGFLSVILILWNSAAYVMQLLANALDIKQGELNILMSMTTCYKIHVAWTQVEITKANTEICQHFSKSLEIWERGY